MERTRSALAFHQAGHAVASVLVPGARPVVRIAVKSTPLGYVGWCEPEPMAFAETEPPPSPDCLQAEAVVAFAGPMAEERFTGTIVEDDDGYWDRHFAMVGSPDRDGARNAAKTLVQTRWGTIETLANRLLRAKELNGDEVREIVEGAAG